MPQLALPGANQPGTRCLYELIVGLSSSDAAGRCSRTPAMAERKIAGSALPSESECALRAPGWARNALAPSLQQER